VELHVFRAEVGEDCDVEDAAVDPAEHEGVTGDLHGDRPHAAFPHDGEESLEVGGFGGGAFGLDALVADARLDRADEAGRFAGAVPETAFDEVCRGGLAGGSGDADLQQVPARLVVDLRGECSYAPARIFDRENRQSGRGGALGTGLVGQDRDRARLCGLRGEVGAVQAGAGQGGVDVAGPDSAGVVGDARGLSGAGGSDWGGDAQLIGEFREGNGVEPHRPWRSWFCHGNILLRGF
jgi:hypothetical protein